MDYLDFNGIENGDEEDKSYLRNCEEKEEIEFKTKYTNNSFKTIINQYITHHINTPLSKTNSKDKCIGTNQEYDINKDVIFDKN